jgi:hypothetical protein
MIIFIIIFFWDLTHTPMARMGGMTPNFPRLKGSCIFEAGDVMGQSLTAAKIGSQLTNPHQKIGQKNKKCLKHFKIHFILVHLNYLFWPIF